MIEHSDISEAETSADTRIDNIVLDDDGHLACDLACVECAYNLRGLAPDGNCPECGALVRRALLGNILEHASPAWISSLHRGVNILSWALPATLVIAAMWPVSIGFGRAPFLTGMLAILCFVDMFGLFLLTRRESQLAVTQERTIWRRFIRLWMMTAIGLCIISFGLSRSVTPQGPVVLHYALITALVMLILGLFAMTRYLVAVFERAREFHVSTTVSSVGDAVSVALVTAMVCWLFQSVRPLLGWEDSELADGFVGLGALLGGGGVIGVCFMLVKARGILVDVVRQPPNVAKLEDDE